MERSLLDLLACPKCRVALAADSGLPDEIHEADLQCPQCGRIYPVRDGIPRFVVGPTDLDIRIAQHFTNEFTAVGNGDRDIDDPRLLEYLFFTRTGIDPVIYERLPGDPYRTALPTDAYSPDGSWLKGKTVLDAGCGPGRFTTIAADAGAGLVVGLDLGDHVERAARRSGDKAVQIVQGSVLEPPFKAGVFDYVFSIGVLHHTGDAARACKELGALVTGNGAMSVWVYPPSYWGGRIRAPINRFIHRRLARKPPSDALRICERLLYRLGRAQAWVARWPWLKFLLAPMFLVSVPRHPRRETMLSTIYDYFCPPTITTHSGSEVQEWLSDAGFRTIRELPVPTSVWAER